MRFWIGQQRPDIGIEKNSRLLVSTDEVIATDPALGQGSAQRGTFDGAVSRQSHRSHSAVRLSAGQRDMIVGANDLEPERPERAQNSIIGRIDWKLGHGGIGKRSSNWNRGLGNERLQHRIVFHRSKRVCPKGLDMKGNG
jgi:hypothetical protein